MNAILILFLLGVLLLAGEVFVPGAVLGILGALCMFAGCVISFLQLGTGGGVLATTVALVLLALTLSVELVWLPKTKIGRKLIVQSTVAATSQPPLADKRSDDEESDQCGYDNKDNKDGGGHGRIRVWLQ